MSIGLSFMSVLSSHCPRSPALPAMSAHCHPDAHGADRSGVQTRLGHLPEELLLRIVDFAYGPDVELDHAYILADRHAVFHALALVDRRLNRLATPLLYKVFATSENPFRERQRIRKTELFLRALRENALLRSHVRGLCLYTAEGRDKYPSLDVFDRVKELVALVPNTHFLHVNGGFDDFRTQTLDIVSTAIVNMRHLRHLSLNRQGYGPTLQDVAEAFRQSWGVKRLSLNGVTAMTGVASPTIHEKVSFATGLRSSTCCRECFIANDQDRNIARRLLHTSHSKTTAKTGRPRNSS